MRFEVVGDSGSEQLDAIPSHDKGSFIFTDTYRGELVTNRIELTGVADSNITAIKAGDIAVAASLVETDPERSDVQRFVLCAGRVSVVIPGSGNTVHGVIHEVREVVPYEPQL